MITRISTILTLALLAGIGCAPKGNNSDSAANPTADSMKAAYMAVTAAWDAGNADSMDRYVSATMIEHNAMPGQKPGLEGMKDMVKMMKAGFPDEKTTIDDIRIDGNTLIARSRMSGTNSGPMMGMPATNKKMTDVMGIDIVRWENGKFVEHWGLFDDHTMMQQLGLAPPMPGAPAGGAPTAPPNDKKM